MMNGPPATQGNIVVVDDQPANLKLMEDTLRQQGYGVRSFPRGRMALAAASAQPPDLVLLDINMPEMSGFEVCRLMKADQRLAPVPVIFLSALDEVDDKVRAFQSGGVDYIGKPFQFEEVQARVETHLRLHRLQQQLRLHNDHLEQMVEERTRNLVEAQARLKVLDKAKGDFLRLISHEFRTPLNGLIGIAEIVLDCPPPESQHQELRDMFGQARRRILTILEDASLLAQIDLETERFTPRTIELKKVMDQAVAGARDLARSSATTVRIDEPAEGLIVGQEMLFTKALRSLLETAIKFSAAGSEVRVGFELGADTARVAIRAHGARVPEPVMARFFDLFAVAESVTVGGDLGLGPPVASRILSMFGGSVTVENLDPPGICLAATLPAAGR